MSTSWREAERAAVRHMKSLGFRDAALTPPGPDRGLDVISGDTAAQVKDYAVPVGRPDIQRFIGAARAFKVHVFYARSGFTATAIAEATSAGVALFRTDDHGFVPVNAAARELDAAPAAQQARAEMSNPAPPDYRFEYQELVRLLPRFYAWRDAQNPLVHFLRLGGESEADRRMTAIATLLHRRKILARSLPRDWNSEMECMREIRTRMHALELWWSETNDPRVALILDDASRRLVDADQEWKRALPKRWKPEIPPAAATDADRAALRNRYLIVWARARSLMEVLQDLGRSNSADIGWTDFLNAQILSMRKAAKWLLRQGKSAVPHHETWARDIERCARTVAAVELTVTRAWHGTANIPSIIADATERWLASNPSDERTVQLRELRYVPGPLVLRD